MKKLHEMSLSSLAGLLKSGELSPVEICRAFIGRKNEVEPFVGAFLNFNEEGILEQARLSENRWKKSSPLSPYDGIPIAVKDNIAVSGERCSCASKILENFISPYDAFVIEKLKSKGFVTYGRTNMDEFAMGSSCENSAFGKTFNPWDVSRVPGGSSGGAAASVAARQVPVALGSDTGGSIRQPAAFCGCVGLKPTYGAVSRYGLVAFASSLDQIGPMSNTVEDAKIIFDLISGRDKRDSTSIDMPSSPVVQSLPGNDLSGLRIGLPKEYLETEGLDAGVRKIVMDSLEVFRKQNAEIIEVSLPAIRYAIADYYVIATAEASANLARFDGIRYGRRAKSDDLIGTYFKSRGQGFGKEVKRRIILGTFVLSSGYYDAYYLKAQKIRTMIREDFRKAFEKCDAILSPTSPAPAFKFGEKSDALQMYLADIYTVSVNLAGVCAISVPADLHPQLQMPVGIQLIGPHFGENCILRIADSFEKNRNQREFIPSVQGGINA